MTSVTIDYTYDAVGNRLTQTNQLAVTNTYVYDDANRLTSVDGVTNTWDANGNLLSDGSTTYLYNVTNKPVSITQGVETYTYTYNGLGARLQQTVGAVTTTYTIDQAAGLTQTLQDGTNSYLYGLGRIAEDDGIDWMYYHTDGLGSIRQLTDGVSNVTLAQSYEPYGDVLQTTGEVNSNYGYAGEWRDATGLQYLRARYLDTGIGRFISRDSWAGDYKNPLSLNRWMYVEGNPVNFVDPSGKTPLWCGIPFIGCVDTAENAILAAKAAYSQLTSTLFSLPQDDFWGNRLNCLSPFWSKPDNVTDLLGDYFCERGPDSVFYDGNDALTIELAQSILLDSIRKEFYNNGGYIDPDERKFGFGEFFIAIIDGYDLYSGELTRLPISHVLGSFDYDVVKTASGRVSFTIKNRTDLASGTRIPLRFPPAQYKENPYSLEQFIEENPMMAKEGVIEIFMNNPEIVSILSPRDRSATSFPLGGGNMRQTFTWSEKFLNCGLQNLPWPTYLPFLNIR